MEAVKYPGSCRHCAVFIRKTLRRQLARQASLFGLDPSSSLLLSASRDDDGSNMPASPSLSMDMLDVCKCAAARLQDRPYSSTISIPRDPSFNCEAMEALGLLSKRPMEPLVAAQLSAMSSRSSCLPSKSDRFQSVETENVRTRQQHFWADRFTSACCSWLIGLSYAKTLREHATPASWEKITVISIFGSALTSM